MAALEILSVSTPDEAPDQLWNSNIDTPAAGATFDYPVLHLAAWAIGRSAPAAAVESSAGTGSSPSRRCGCPARISWAYADTPEAGMPGWPSTSMLATCRKNSSSP